MKNNFLRLVASYIIVVTIFTGCQKDSDIVSKNLSTQADMFEIDRRVVFYNSITNNYILSIEGKCSIKKDTKDNQLEVTCKTGQNLYKKHYLGISDNVTYFAEQLNPKQASAYHYRVIFKPQSITPDIDFKGSSKEAIGSVIPDKKD